jgi:hypothetical protein
MKNSVTSAAVTAIGFGMATLWALGGDVILCSEDFEMQAIRPPASIVCWCRWDRSA